MRFCLWCLLKNGQLYSHCRFHILMGQGSSLERKSVRMIILIHFAPILS